MMRDAEDGTFLVRDSSNNPGEFTLTVKKGGSNRLVRIVEQDGRYGFAPPGHFDSVVSLVEYFMNNSLINYNKKLDVVLSNPLSRFPVVSVLPFVFDCFSVCCSV